MAAFDDPVENIRCAAECLFTFWKDSCETHGKQTRITIRTIGAISATMNPSSEPFDPPSKKRRYMRRCSVTEFALGIPQEHLEQFVTVKASSSGCPLTLNTLDRPSPSRITSNSDDHVMALDGRKIRSGNNSPMKSSNANKKHQIRSLRNIPPPHFQDSTTKHEIDSPPKGNGKDSSKLLA